MDPFVYEFPAIRGIQANQEYYVSMCPLRIIPKLFSFKSSLPVSEPHRRAQRLLNKARIPAIRDYILNNPNDYVFSAIAVSIDGEVEFKPVDNKLKHFNIGQLRIPIGARFIINDGQHRKAAIEAALLSKPELGNESIACVFFIDTGLKRSQQIFADLNRYAIRPTHSLNILYDHREPSAKIARELVERVGIFSNMTEMEKTTISNRSTKLFTLSGIHRATKELLSDFKKVPFEDALLLAVSYWEEVAKYIPDWKKAKKGNVSAAELRKNHIHSHTVALVALGRTGRALFIERPDDWQEVLKRLKSIDWSRNNKKWEGRAMVGGKVSISHNNITLLTCEIKKTLGLTLSDDELEAETTYTASKTIE
jgi:DNA sulfur modification protein DndB